MSSDALALPRARRRRRRPPNRKEVEAILLMLVDVFLVLNCVGSFVLDSSEFWKVFDLIAAVLFTRTALNSWRIVWNYIKNGYEDDD